MSSEMVIRNRAAKEMGYIKVEKSGKQTAYNRRREKLGYFDPKKNVTRDIKERVVGSGNMLVGLVLSSV